MMQSGHVSNISRSSDVLAFHAETFPDMPADILPWATLRSRDVKGQPAAAFFDYDGLRLIISWLRKRVA